MFTALTLLLALSAQVPTPAAPVPTGAVPKVMELKANADGKIMVSILATERVQGIGSATYPGGGKVPPGLIFSDVTVNKLVELGEVKDLTITTVDGKKIEKEAAIKRLAGGALVVVSSNGKPVSPAHLKIFKDDTLVLTSPYLVGPVPEVLPPRPVLIMPPGGVHP
jgi:hypothetical protein